MLLEPNTLKTVKVWHQGLTQLIASTHPFSTCLRHNLRDGATCTTRHRTSVSLQARLKNPNQTNFHAKKAAKS
jgi:hypothetical protein